MSINITEGYVPGCIGRVAELHARYYSATSGFGVEFEAKVACELSDFCRSYQSNRDGLWLAQGAQIEGSVALDGRHARESGAHLRWFVVSDALRGQGMGTRLLECALRFADIREYESVYLWTFAGLDAARHLYESHGFKLVQESPGSQWGTVVNEQKFVRAKASGETHPK